MSVSHASTRKRLHWTVLRRWHLNKKKLHDEGKNHRQQHVNKTVATGLRVDPDGSTNTNMIYGREDIECFSVRFSRLISMLMQKALYLGADKILDLTWAWLDPLCFTHSSLVSIRFLLLLFCYAWISPSLSSFHLCHCPLATGPTRTTGFGSQEREKKKKITAQGWLMCRS